MKLLSKIYRNRKKYSFLIKYVFLDRWVINQHMYSIEETLANIYKGVSVCRFGEGELKWILGIEQHSFQDSDAAMSEELRHVLESDIKNVLICIPDVMGNYGRNIKKLSCFSKKYWLVELGENGKIFSSVLDKKRKYYNLNITRFYMDYKDKNVKNYFDKWVDIFSGLDIVVVEGEYTRFGIGNDLLDSAQSVKRILCPARNAFDVKSQIEKYIIEYIDKNTLILIALGPTATVVSFDLALEGFWCIDIGHLDMEYQWYKENATYKVGLKGKYVNEVGGLFDEEFEPSLLDQYNKQVITKIGC